MVVVVVVVVGLEEFLIGVGDIIGAEDCEVTPTDDVGDKALVGPFFELLPFPFPSLDLSLPLCECLCPREDSFLDRGVDAGVSSAFGGVGVGGRERDLRRPAFPKFVVKLSP